MTRRYLRAVAIGLALAALAFLLTRIPVEPLPAEARNLPTSVFCALMIVIAVLDLLAPWLAYRALRRDRSVTALRDQVVRFLATAAGANGIALLGVLYLLGYRVADGGGLMTLTAAVVVLSVPPVLWTIQYFRRS